MKSIIETDKDFICDLQAPCFQTLSPEEMQLVQESRTQVLFRKGDNLTKQGTFASYVLFMVEGLAKQYIEGDDGKSFNLRIIKPSEFVGLSSVFTTNTFNYSSIALTDCHAFLVEKSAILKIIAQNGAFALSIIQRYCTQNVNLFESLRTVLYKQMNGRVAETLLYVNAFKREFPHVFQLLSRKDVADFAGISTESTVKLLKTLEKEELIELDGKDIHLLKSDLLEAIAKRG